MISPKLNPMIFKNKDEINLENISKIPILINNNPKNFKVTNTYFVDSSGFGQEDEIALTIKQFIEKIKVGFYYAIKDAGQFQVYINEYKKDYNMVQDIKFLEGTYKKARVINKDQKIILISYNSEVAYIKNNILTINGEYSRTTKRHIAQFKEEYLRGLE